MVTTIRPTGTVSFLGAARFQGHWDAATNTAAGSGLDGALATGAHSGLIVDGGFLGSSGYTAEFGDYLQVTVPSSDTVVDGVRTWNLNDWIIFTGDTADETVPRVWIRLPWQDTIASIVHGNSSGAGLHSSPSDVYIILAGETTYLGPTTATQLQKLLEVFGEMQIRGKTAVTAEFNPDA